MHQSIRTQLIQVWRVTLQLDSQNRGASLSAMLLSSFSRENCGSLRFISLLGRSIAFAVQTNVLGIPDYIAIVDWVKANVQSQSHRDAALNLLYPRKVMSINLTPVSRSFRLLFIHKLT